MGNNNNEGNTSAVFRNIYNHINYGGKMVQRTKTFAAQIITKGT
jgi:hypothetical protein